MGFFDWVRGNKRAPLDVATLPARPSYFASDTLPDPRRARQIIESALAVTIKAHRHKLFNASGAEVAMDDSTDGIALKAMPVPPNVSELQIAWFAQQTFIGYQLCAMLAQNWAIDRACSLPARDAVRHGFDVVTIDGEKLDKDAAKILHRFDRQFRLNWNLEQFVRMGRIFGIRIALFVVESTDPDYYLKPFNIDGVAPGSYRGIVQVDPYWTAPMLDQESTSMPASQHFYEPTWWMISGKRYHRSHLVIFRNSDPPDLLKPQYLYGGVPIPQQIMERVFAAERTANETPALVMSKRLNVWLTNMAAFNAQGQESVDKMNFWSWMRDNWGVKLGQKDEDEFQQFETSLTDLDDVTMVQYQLVAAAARIPFTKFMGSPPKGFDATGEYDEANYHEDLESTQLHDLTPMVERHHALTLRSYVVPGIAGMSPPKPELARVQTTVAWRPLDAPTAEEKAATNLVKAQTAAALVQVGSIDGVDDRARLAADPDSGYTNLADREPIPPETDDPEAGRGDDDK